MNDAEDPTRRTRLAAERTWLAWWRSGIAAATAAVAVGGVVPELVDEGRSLWLLIGGGYALLAAAVFVLAALRQRRVEGALRTAGWDPLGAPVVLGLTLAAVVLTLASLAAIVTQA